MINRTTKLRWRRRIRHSRRQVEDLGLQAEEHLERHFFRRIGRFNEIRRFVASWVLLLVILTGGVIIQTRNLDNYYQTLRPVPGGTFNEGVLGGFTNANPLYATGLVDGGVSRLVFSSLLDTDQNNNLVGDLADSWQVDSRAVQYTVHLRSNLLWHDGVELTADDVVFTYKTIQNPDAKSPLFGSWQGIKVDAVNKRTVTFTLPNSLSSFLYSLTNGIVPKHILKDIPVSQLRAVRFNTVKPIGSGPFIWDHIEVAGSTPETREEKIGLIANEHYYGGRPKLDSFVVRSFHDEKHMIASFQKSELDAMAGLDNVPDVIKQQSNFKDYNIPLSGEVVVFLKTSSQNLKDPRVRQALVKAVDQQDIIKGLGYSVIVANEPLLKRQVGYDATRSQLGKNVEEAKQILDSAGWIKGKDGIRSKDGNQLSFTLFAQNSSEYTYVTQKLQAQWQAIGANVQVQLEPVADLQSVVSRHEYDSLLYGISLGPDPDVFPYWHSSQADPRSTNRLNLSEYKSAVADKSLEAGRTRTDPVVRALKYRPFLDAWRADAPAIVLYQPRFLYISRSEIFGFNPSTLNVAADRYDNVHNWMIKQAKVKN